MIPRFNVEDYQSLLSVSASASSSPSASVAPSAAAKNQPSGASGRSLLFEWQGQCVFFDSCKISFGDMLILIRSKLKEL